MRTEKIALDTKRTNSSGVVETVNLDFNQLRSILELHAGVYAFLVRLDGQATQLKLRAAAVENKRDRYHVLISSSHSWHGTPKTWEMLQADMLRYFSPEIESLYATTKDGDVGSQRPSISLTSYSDILKSKLYNVDGGDLPTDLNHRVAILNSISGPKTFEETFNLPAYISTELRGDQLMSLITLGIETWFMEIDHWLTEDVELILKHWREAA
jgi:hypothetical protein